VAADSITDQESRHGQTLAMPEQDREWAAHDCECRDSVVQPCRYRDHPLVVMCRTHDRKQTVPYGGDLIKSTGRYDRISAIHQALRRVLRRARITERIDRCQ
jgi:hypothetical protein